MPLVFAPFRVPVLAALWLKFSSTGSPVARDGFLSLWLVAHLFVFVPFRAPVLVPVSLAHGRDFRVVVSILLVLA